MPFIEDFSEFSSRQMGTPVKIENPPGFDRPIFVWSNGSYSTGELGKHYDSPDDPDDVPTIERQLMYCRARLAQAERCFFRYQSTGGDNFQWDPDQLGRPVPNHRTDPNLFDCVTADYDDLQDNEHLFEPNPKAILLLIRNIVLARRKSLFDLRTRLESLPAYGRADDVAKQEQWEHYKSRRRSEHAERARQQQELMAVTLDGLWPTDD